MARLLARNGVETAIITAAARNVGDTSFEIIDLGMKRSTRLTTLAGFVRKAQMLAADRKFEIVHAVTPIPNADVYQLRAGLIETTFRQNLARRSLLGATARRMVGPNPRQRFLRRMEKHLAYRTNCVFLAVSEYVREQIRHHLQLPEQRMRVIYNGVDLERFRRQHQSVGLFVANNLKLKGMDLILAAMGSLAETHDPAAEKIKIIVIGTDRFWPYYKQAQRQHLLDKVIFLGPCQDMTRLYQLADFVVHPTWHDPCSRVVLEAVASNLPSITSNFNGAAEIVKQADCGVVIEDLTSPGELTDALKQMLDVQFRRRLAENCPKVHEQIGMARHVGELIDLYEELQKQ